MISGCWHFNEFRVIILQHSRTVHLNPSLVKPWNCCVEREQTSRGFLACEQHRAQPGWLSDKGDHAETYLPDAYPQHRWTETAVDSVLVQSWPEHYWYGYCLTSGAEDFEHSCQERSCPALSDHIWLVLCDRLAQILRTLLKKCIRNVDI